MHTQHASTPPCHPKPRRRHWSRHGANYSDELATDTILRQHVQVEARTSTDRLQASAVRKVVRGTVNIYSRADNILNSSVCIGQYWDVAVGRKALCSAPSPRRGVLHAAPNPERMKSKRVRLLSKGVMRVEAENAKQQFCTRSSVMALPL